MMNVSELDKDTLAEYARNTFKVDLDMRKNLEKLRAEVTLLQTKPVKTEPEFERNPKATHILNLDTKLFFPWTKELKKALENAVDCDVNGTPV